MGLIPNADEYVRTVCKIGQGADCCRYLTMSPKGWDCVKLTLSPTRSLEDIMHGRPEYPSAKELLDARVAAGTMHARGDNCEGR